MTEPPPAFAAGSVVVGTYNLRWMRQPRRLRHDLEKLEFVCVWAFQEVSCARAADDLPTRLRALLPPGAWHVAHLPLNPEHALYGDWEAQAVASRYPITRVETWELRSHGRKRRAALAAWLDLGGGAELLLVNTDHEPSVLSFARDSRQVKSLLDHLDHRRDARCVIAGDFNTAGNVARRMSGVGDVAELRGAMSAAGFNAAGGGGRTTFRGLFGRHALDHIFLRGVTRIRSGVAAGARGSDHLPVWCEFDVTTTGPP